VDPPAARGLGVTDQTEFVEQWLEDVDGDGARLRESRAGLRVEVHPQLVGMVGVRTPHLPRMKGHGAHLGGPHHRRRVGHLQRVRGTAGRERHPAGLQIVRMLLGHPLLVDLLAVDPVGESLQMRGAVAQRGQQWSGAGHRAVVLDESALGPG
jgi:hypothetical protein